MPARFESDRAVASGVIAAVVIAAVVGGAAVMALMPQGPAADEAAAPEARQEAEPGDGEKAGGEEAGGEDAREEAAAGDEAAHSLDDSREPADLELPAGNGYSEPPAPREGIVGTPEQRGSDTGVAYVGDPDAAEVVFADEVKLVGGELLYYEEDGTVQLTVTSTDDVEVGDLLVLNPGAQSGSTSVVEVVSVAKAGGVARCECRQADVSEGYVRTLDVSAHDFSKPITFAGGTVLL